MIRDLYILIKDRYEVSELVELMSWDYEDMVDCTLMDLIAEHYDELLKLMEDEWGN